MADSDAARHLHDKSHLQLGLFERLNANEGRNLKAGMQIFGFRFVKRNAGHVFEDPKTAENTALLYFMTECQDILLPTFEGIAPQSTTLWFIHVALELMVDVGLLRIKPPLAAESTGTHPSTDSQYDVHNNIKRAGSSIEVHRTPSIIDNFASCKEQDGSMGFIKHEHTKRDASDAAIVPETDIEDSETEDEGEFHAAFHAARKLVYRPLLHVPTKGQMVKIAENWNQFFYVAEHQIDEPYNGINTQWRKKRTDITYYSEEDAFSGFDFIAYLKSSGLPVKHAKELEKWFYGKAESVQPRPKKGAMYIMSPKVVEQFARRCGFYETLKPFLDFCKKPTFDQDFWCIKCHRDLESSLYEPSSNWKSHWRLHEAPSSSVQSSGHCPHPGCNAVFCVDWVPAINKHVETCEYRVEWLHEV